MSEKSVTVGGKEIDLYWAVGAVVYFMVMGVIFHFTNPSVTSTRDLLLLAAGSFSCAAYISAVKAFYPETL